VVTHAANAQEGTHKRETTKSKTALYTKPHTITHNHTDSNSLVPNIFGQRAKRKKKEKGYKEKEERKTYTLTHTLVYTHTHTNTTNCKHGTQFHL